jgi:type I restriction enzyme R subunit
MERIASRLEQMLRANPGRIDLYQRYQAIIAEYNHDKDDAQIQRVFDDLLKQHEAMNVEERRYVREGFANEKVLAVYDLLSKDKLTITKADIEKIKNVARDLMETVATRRVEMGDLRDRAAAQAQMKAAIIDHLLTGLPDPYSSDDIEVRAEVVFQYVQQQMQSAMLH